MSPLATAKQAYAGAAQATGRGLRRAGRLQGAPPPVRQRTRHWLRSLVDVHDSMAMARLGVPWWTYGAIDAVEIWLSARTGPVRVFEYGSGASTIWLSERADEVHSTEHHAGFAELMRPELDALDNVTLRVVEPVPSSHPHIGSGKEDNAGLDFAAYVGAIDDVPGEFDLVVVDGRAREACLAAAVPRLAAGGVVVFDNSRRRRYRSAIESSPLTERTYRGLTPTLPYPEQTSLLRS